MKFVMLLLLSLTLYGADKIYEYGDLEVQDDGTLIETKTKVLANGIGKFYYDSGRVRGETPFKDGKREGLGKTYYETGELQSETLFKNDMIEGLRKSYFTSGKVQSETPFVNDKAQGVAKIKVKHHFMTIKQKVSQNFIMSLEKLRMKLYLNKALL